MFREGERHRRENCSVRRQWSGVGLGLRLWRRICGSIRRGGLWRILWIGLVRGRGRCLLGR